MSTPVPPQPLPKAPEPDERTERPGAAFERLVAAVQSRLDPGSDVRWNEKVNGRQIDATVRGRIGSADILVVVECRDYADVLGIEHVDQLDSVREEVGASKAILVTRTGFTGPALAKAVKVGIDTCVLRPSTDDDHPGPGKPLRSMHMTIELVGTSIDELEVELVDGRRFAHELSALVKASTDEAMRALAPHLRDAVARVTAVEEVLRPLRDSLGAHVRPKNADKSEASVEARVLRNHPLLEGSVCVLRPTKETSYRGLSQTSLLFAWPDADDDSTLEAKHVALQEAVLGSAGDVMRVVDAVLVYHWWKVGTIEPPEGYDFGVRNSERSGYRPVPRP